MLQKWFQQEEILSDNIVFWMFSEVSFAAFLYIVIR